MEGLLSDTTTFADYLNSNETVLIWGAVATGTCLLLVIFCCIYNIRRSAVLKTNRNVDDHEQERLEIQRAIDRKVRAVNMDGGGSASVG